MIFKYILKNYIQHFEKLVTRLRFLTFARKSGRDFGLFTVFAVTLSHLSLLFALDVFFLGGSVVAF